MGHPWYAFYPADYRNKTSGLTMVQDCAYRRLIDEYYITGEPLRPDVEEICRICRASGKDERAAVLFVLKRYFVEGDDGWHHLRIDEEIVIRADMVAQKKAAAAAGGIAARGKSGRKKNSTTITGAIADAIPDAISEEFQKNAQSHTQEEKKVSKKSAPSAPTLIPDWLDLPTWEAFKAMRQRIRKPLVPEGEPLIIRKLGRWREKGHDPTEILNYSIEGSYQGIFEPKTGTGNGQRDRRPSAHDNNNAGTILYLEKLARESGGQSPDSDSPDPPRKLLLAP